MSRNIVKLPVPGPSAAVVRMGEARREAELPAELENQFVLRLPPEPAKGLRDALRSGTMTVKDRLSIKMENDVRHGMVYFDNYVIPAKVVDLPTIIETLKTIDNKSFYKTADVSQILICKEEEDQTTTDDELTTKTKKKDPNKVDKKFLWPHGITPPMKNVRKRRFRKTLKKKYTDAPEIEKEVKRLLRVDNDAAHVRWEVIDEEDEKSKDSQGKEGGGGALKEGEVSMGFSNQLSMDVAEHDIFGEVLSDSEEDESKINIMELEDNSRFSGDDSRMSDSHIASIMQLQGEKEKKPLVTHFSQEMFQDKNIFEKPSSSGNNQESPFVMTVPKQEGQVFVKSEDYLKDDFGYGYQSNQPSKEEIYTRLQTLKQELGELRLRRTQQEAEIANIENLALQQRFQEILDNLIVEQGEKEREYEELLAMAH